jgi:CheY-like chemotaxis protein
MTRNSRSALIVSDSAPLRRYAASSLEAAEFFCVEAASGFQAVDRVTERLFALYVIDLDMPLTDGVSIFAIALYGMDPSPVVLGWTTRPEHPRRGVWAPDSFAGVIGTPFRPDDLAAAARAAVGATA